jgi:tetratricopeptide (TPR) repeat protein
MKTRLKWSLPACILAAFTGLAYRWIQAPKPAVPADPATIPALMIAHAPAADKEHEIAALRKDLEKNPNHVPILLRLAQMSREVGRLAESVRYLSEAVAQDSTNRDARLELGRSLFETGDFDGAIRETNALLEQHPKDVDALYNLGAIYGNLGQDRRAREYWEAAVATAPDSESGKRAVEGLKQLSGSSP